MSIPEPVESYESSSDRAAANAGLVDEDIYCLTCGYNLRGLYGDPVRCPECGEWNNLGTVRIPAKHIQRALREMETAPTLCVACGVIVVGCAPLALIADRLELACLSLVDMLALAGYGYCLVRTKNVYGPETRWWEILFRFHLATLLFVLPISIITWMMLGFNRLSSTPFERPRTLLLSLLILPLLLVAISVHKRTQNLIASLHREAAVRIAREMLRHALTRPRR
jgi:hypothetical protein